MRSATTLAVFAALALALALPASAAESALALEYACQADVVAQINSGAVNGSCCNGMYCPYAAGVCCPGSTHCCPQGLVCLPTGQNVLPQCGTASAYVGSPLQQGACAQGAACPPLPAGADPSDVVPVLYIGQNVAQTVPRGSIAQDGGVVVKPGSPAAAAGAKGAKPVQVSDHVVQLRLQVSNFVYNFYKDNTEQVKAALRLDLAREENLAEESVNVTGAIPMRGRTPGSAAEEQKLLSKRKADEESAKKASAAVAAAAAKAQAAAKPALVETEATFSPVSGVEFLVRLYCPSHKAAMSLARHLFGSLKAQSVQLTSLEGLPDSARANVARGFPVLKSSVVAVGGKRVTDAFGVQAARLAHEGATGATRRVKRMKSDLQGVMQSIKESRSLDAANMRRMLQELDRKHKLSERARLIREFQLQKAQGSVDPKLAAAVKKATTPAVPPTNFLRVGVPFRLNLTTAPNLVTAYGSGFRIPQVTRVKDICYLSGHVKLVKVTTDPLLVLPEGCRPMKSRVYDRHVGPAGKTAMVRIEGPGELRMAAGSTETDYLSLDGMQFPATLAGIKPIALNSSWKAMDSGFAPPGYTTVGGVCNLGGVVQMAVPDMNAWNPIVGTLPAECRPDKRVIFYVSNAENSIRLDVLPTGLLFVAGGVRTRPWLSLDGVYFFTGGANVKPIKLGPSYNNFADTSFRAPSYFVEKTTDGNVCVLGGIFSFASGINNLAFITNLPAECRPQSKLAFHVARGEGVARIDIAPNGDVTWQNSAADGAKWIALDNIHFVMSGLQSWEK